MSKKPFITLSAPYSNTTLVKVKFITYIKIFVNKCIQIQHLLKLNFKAPNKPPVISNSNTTLVKVKF